MRRDTCLGLDGPGEPGQIVAGHPGKSLDPFEQRRRDGAAATLVPGPAAPSPVDPEVLLRRPDDHLLDRAVELVPDAPDVLLAKALWLVRSGDAQAGVVLLKQAWQLAPASSRYAYVYVVALHSVGRSGEALQAADQALALRRDEQLLQTAFSIARDANMPDKARAYAQQLQSR